MYITELEIDNFKSFRKKTKIPFFEGFTVISGPNGSGKSNIIDSILFCLALSSARGLRAERLTDLINLNSGKNTAEVAITFSDGTTIRRRIKKTAHGYYSYNYLNDRLCKQGDVIEFLAKYGVKAEGYNVVMQGDVTRIMEMSDNERRKIIDEIAGVAEFDKKKDQALGELEVVRERIEREELLLHELDIRLGELKREREQALKYRHWQEQLEFFKNCLSSAQLKEREKELISLLDLIENRKEEITALDTRREEWKGKIDECEGEVHEVDREINEKSGDEYLALLAAMEEARGQITLAGQNQDRLKSEKEENLESIKRIFLDSKRAEGRTGECSESIRSLTVDRSSLSMELATRKAEYDRISRTLQNESDAVSGTKEELFSLMKELEDRKSARADTLREQDTLIEKSRLRTSEKERLSGRFALVQEEKAEKLGQSEEFSGEILRLTGEKEELDQRLSSSESSLFSTRSSIEKINGEIRGKERELMRLEAQHQAVGGPGGRAMEAILGMEGVYGTVAQLGRAPPEYANALDIAAGGRLRYVVVETDAVAADAIRYLKEQRLGRVTFLPLNKLKTHDLPPLRKKDDSVIDYAVNLLDYDPLFDPVFRQIFGATVVVDKLENARKMMGSYRMVTMDGDLIEKGGAMTGGSQQKKLIGFGVAADEEIARIHKEIAALRLEAEDLEHASLRYGQEAEEGRRQRSSIEEQIARFRMLSDEYTRRIESLMSEISGIEDGLAGIDSDVSSGASKLAEIEEILEAENTEISRIAKEIDELKSRLEDTCIPEMSDKLERLRREIEEHEKRLRNKESDISDLQRERQHFQRRIEEFSQQRSSLEERNGAIDLEISSLGDLIKDKAAEIIEFEERQKTFSRIIVELQTKRDDLVEKIRGYERKILEIDADHERISLQIVSLFERESSLRSEIVELREKAGDRDTELSLQEIEVGIAGADRELKKIGAVNMLAIDEYERVETRISDRREKKETLSRERTTLIERIEHFEKMKYDSFMVAFRAIDENFRSIFARLTSGSGNLILENDDEPFSGGMTFAVQPRDKKVHLLSALSGGEKSLTTLAFIFAIQQYMPAPFYALDEVDMMLDGSNAERIATMIGELSHNAQSVCVSLRRPMIEGADRIIGVTVRPDKSTYVTGVKNNA